MKNQFLLLFFFSLLFLNACKHDVIEPVKSLVIDTTGNGNGGSGGTGTGGNANPCDPTKVYFVNDVLPIFLSNCAFSGCHDASSAQDGVILDSYFNILSTGEINPGNAHRSEVYEKITETDQEDVMPPAPRARLSAAQINLIARWINDGAQNSQCNEANSCDTLYVAYSTHIQPMITTYCKGCHSGTAPSGGISLANYADVKLKVDDASLLGAVKRVPGYSAMPKNGNKLSDCNIRKLELWIKKGALNN